MGICRHWHRRPKSTRPLVALRDLSWLGLSAEKERAVDEDFIKQLLLSIGIAGIVLGAGCLMIGLPLVYMVTH